jgi:hypothetical protein
MAIAADGVPPRSENNRIPLGAVAAMIKSRMAQDGCPEISSRKANPTPMAAPNPSAHVRRFQKNGADTGYTQLEEPFGPDSQLQENPLLTIWNFSQSF